MALVLPNPFQCYQYWIMENSGNSIILYENILDAIMGYGGSIEDLKREYIYMNKQNS